MTDADDGAVQSIRQRLLNRSRELDVEFQFLLDRYAVERFLYRLGRSRWADRFVLKGGTLFLVWMDRPYRPTRDLDLSWSAGGSWEELRPRLEEICRLPCPEDGLRFDLQNVKLRQMGRLQGLRITLKAFLGSARLILRLDIGSEDATTQEPLRAIYPTLLDHPAPEILVYPKETFIAEKFEAMIRRGENNTRWWDFSDIVVLARREEFDGNTLFAACACTFRECETRLDRSPLLAPFYSEPTRSESWDTYRKTHLAEAELGSFPEVGEVIITFLLPLFDALAHGTSWSGHWPPGGPWQPSSH